MTTRPIELEQFLKKMQLAGSGGHAKLLIRSGTVQVNGEPETRRGRKLKPGDIVSMEGRDFVVPEQDQE